MKSDENMSIIAKDDNTIDYFIHHKKEKYPLGNKKQDIENDQKILIGKSLDNKSIKNILLEHLS